MSNILNLVSEEVYREKMDTQNALLAAIAANNINIVGGGLNSIRSALSMGIAPRVFPVGSELLVPHDVMGDVIMQVGAHNHHKAANPEYDNTMTLIFKNVFGSTSEYKGFQFCAPQAFYHAPDGLAAGTYNFTLLQGYDTDYGGGKTFEFTLTQAVPVGGQLTFPWGYNVQASTIKVYSWASNTDTAGIENVSVTEGTGGTALGEINGTGNLNYTHRIRYGSNNYAQSAIRQLLNSSAAVGSVWTPQTRFDRPPSWHTSADGAYAGFMRGFGEDFLSMVVAAEIPYRTNSVYETASLDGTQYATNTVYTLRDKFFLLSRPEIYGTWDSSSYKDGELLELYSGMTDLERAKYDAFGTGRYTWLRSPYPSFANIVRTVCPDGVLSHISASLSRGVAPACIIGAKSL